MTEFHNIKKATRRDKDLERLQDSTNKICTKMSSAAGLIYCIGNRCHIWDYKRSKCLYIEFLRGRKS